MPLTEDEVKKSVEDYTQRKRWGYGPSSDCVTLTEQKVRRDNFNASFDQALRAIRGEIQKKALADDYYIEVIPHGIDNNENSYQDFLFIRVRLFRK